MADVHVCRPHVVWLRSVRLCPTCDRRRRMVGSAAVWYGTTWTCCACGDSWGDGERLPRPFTPGWRDKARTEARRHWTAASPRREALRQWRALVAEEVPRG